MPMTNERLVEIAESPAFPNEQRAQARECLAWRKEFPAMRGLHWLDRQIVRVAIREGFVTERDPREPPEEAPDA